MHNQVPVKVARERNRTLHELATEKKLAFMRSFVGKTLDAITLNSSSNLWSSRTEKRDWLSEPCPVVEEPCLGDGARYTEALTDNYLRLRLPSHHEPNRWLTAQIKAVEERTLLGVAPS
jgi:tRNA A37 methylthiotransferase MiaB